MSTDMESTKCEDLRNLLLLELAFVELPHARKALEKKSPVACTTGLHAVFFINPTVCLDLDELKHVFRLSF